MVDNRHCTSGYYTASVTAPMTYVAALTSRNSAREVVITLNSVQSSLCVIYDLLDAYQVLEKKLLTCKPIN
jgi:hypothetical protein